MPRRESYLTDDEDDAPRRGNASGGGIPAWLWVGGAVGVGAVLLVVGLGFSLFTARQGAARREAAHVADARPEVARPRLAVPDDGGTRRVEPRVKGVPGEPPVIPLARIAEVYREDRAKADRLFQGQRLRVECQVRPLRKGHVGAVADLSPEPVPPEPIGRAIGEEVRGPREQTANVVFEVPDLQHVGEPRVVIEATCAGLTDDPVTGLRLTFTNGRFVPHDGH
jgi:hypothetical protein